MTESIQSMHGQVAVVTGGAGGIGSAISLKLATAGADIVITYNKNTEKAEALLATLPAGNHMILQSPVDDSVACAHLAETITDKYGKVNLLVNNAGITTPVPHADLEGLDDEWIDAIFRINWRGAFATIRALKPLLQATSPSTIINLSSVAAQTGIGSNVAYCASKAALDSMTRSLARAFAPEIRVVSVSPGWVLGEYAKKMDPTYIQQQTNATPLQRLASPEDVAATILAVHTQLTFMTGNIVPVDGGRPLS